MYLMIFSYIALLPLVFSFIVSSRSTLSRSPSSMIATTTEKTMDTERRARYERRLEDFDEMEPDDNYHYRKSREMSTDHKDEHHEEDEKKSVKDDPWDGYYDFIINEGSFKFWAAFQLVTAALLIYSAFAAVYYAKFNIITTDYDYYDDFYGRDEKGRAASGNLGQWSSWWNSRNGLSLFSTQTFQRIMDTLSTLPSSSSSSLQSKSFNPASRTTVTRNRDKKKI